eukprot:817040-Rhodomonas_salina.2
MVDAASRPESSPSQLPGPTCTSSPGQPAILIWRSEDSSFESSCPAMDNYLELRATLLVCIWLRDIPSADVTSVLTSHVGLPGPSAPPSASLSTAWFPIPISERSFSALDPCLTQQIARAGPGGAAPHGEASPDRPLAPPRACLGPRRPLRRHPRLE